MDAAVRRVLQRLSLILRRWQTSKKYCNAKLPSLMQIKWHKYRERKLLYPTYVIMKEHRDYDWL